MPNKMFVPGSIDTAEDRHPIVAAPDAASNRHTFTPGEVNEHVLVGPLTYIVPLREAVSYVTKVTSAHPSDAAVYTTTFVTEVCEKLGPFYPALWSMHAGATFAVRNPRMAQYRYSRVGEEVFDVTCSSLVRLNEISAEDIPIQSLIGLLWSFGEQVEDIITRDNRRRTPWATTELQPIKTKASAYIAEVSDERSPWARRAHPARADLIAPALAA